MTAPRSLAAFTALLISILCTSSLGAQGILFTNPVLPIEGKEIRIVYQDTSASKEREVIRLKITDPQGEEVTVRELPLTSIENGLQAAMNWTPPKNGMYRLFVSSEYNMYGEMSIDLPVIVEARDMDFAWYSYRPELRWATVVTSCGEDDIPVLHVRGAKALRWRAGENRRAEGQTPEETRAKATKYYRIPEDFPFDGYGIDEFGGYPQSESEHHNYAQIRGLIDARALFPDNFYVAGWHCGGVRDEAVGLHKQALDLLLIEAYVMHWVPKELAAENIYEDLRVRLIAARGADMFTRTYGSICRTLLALDITGAKQTTLPDLGEFEQVIRFIRRLCPEMRGIGFFNGSATDRSVERWAHDLCFKYFIKPVVTLQSNSLWIRQTEGGTELVAAVSNIGGMDSGDVTVQFTADGQVLATKHAANVPAGYSRLTNRALLAIPWRPATPGTYTLRAEIIHAPGSTILDPVVEEHRFVSPGR